ncbi:MAG: VUT family protein [Rubrobacteraceae bacterium]
MSYAVLFVLTVVGANWAISTFGLVPVGFGLLAPAGVYFAGLAFCLRDLAQEKIGKLGVFAAILIGAGLSAFLSPGLALASGVAFLVSEMLDFAVYTPLRKRAWLGAVAASNVVGAVADSVIFLALAFGSQEFLAGQVVGKLWVTVLFLPFLWLTRRRLDVVPHG